MRVIDVGCACVFVISLLIITRKQSIFEQFMVMPGSAGWCIVCTFGDDETLYLQFGKCIVCAVILVV